MKYKVLGTLATTELHNTLYHDLDFHFVLLS